MSRLFTSLVAIALFFVFAMAAVAQSPLGPAPEKGALLLRNGRVLRGKITRDGDVYFIALGGGEIRVKAGDVEMVGRDLSEFYRQKRGRILRGDVNDHLDLAQWCIDQELLAAAAGELAAAMAIESRHPRILLLDRRLHLARQAPPSRVASVSLTRDVPTVAELEKTTRDLPQGVVEGFTKLIQPILRNHCSTAGCHGAQSPTTFRLLRSGTRRTPSRRMTQRNLYAALATIDRRQWADSALLAKIIEPHGGAKTAIFKDRDDATYLLLADWARQVAGNPKPTGPASVGARPPLLQNMPPSSGGDSGRRLTEGVAARKEVSTTERSSSAVGSKPGGASENTALRGNDRSPRGSKPALFTPRDPFDPEIFNRRFFLDRVERTTPPSGPNAIPDER